MNPDHRTEWYRFSIKSLLISMALISLGVTSLIWSARLTRTALHVGWAELAPFPFWFGGGSLIGAGLLYPFGKANWGALIGGVFQLALLAIVIALAFTGVIPDD